MLAGRETCISSLLSRPRLSGDAGANCLGRPWPMLSRALWLEARPQERAILFKSAQFSSFYFDLTLFTCGWRAEGSVSRDTPGRPGFRVDVGMRSILHGLAPTQNLSLSYRIIGAAVRFHWQARREESRQRRRHGRRVRGATSERLARSGRTRGWSSSPCE